MENLTENEKSHIALISLLRQEAEDTHQYLCLDTMSVISKDEVKKSKFIIIKPDRIVGSFDSIKSWFNNIHDEVVEYNKKIWIIAYPFENFSNEIIPRVVFNYHLKK